MASPSSGDGVFGRRGSAGRSQERRPTPTSRWRRPPRERGDNWNRKPDTGGGGPRAFGCGAQDGPLRLATAMGRRRRDEPGTQLPLRVCGKGVGHTSVQCRTYRLWHHAICVGFKAAADISRLARERGTRACRACPATPPATPPEAPRPRTPPAPPGHLPTPTPQPQPPTARRDATPTAATGLRERRPAPPQVVTTGRLQARSSAAQDTAVKLQRSGRPTNRAPEAQVVLLQETKLTAQDTEPRFPGYNVAARRDNPNETNQPTTPPSSPRPPPASDVPTRAGWTCKRRGPAARDSWCAGCRARKKCTERTQPTPVPPDSRPRHQPEQRGTSRPGGGEKDETSGVGTNGPGPGQDNSDAKSGFEVRNKNRHKASGMISTYHEPLLTN